MLSEQSDVKQRSLGEETLLALQRDKSVAVRVHQVTCLKSCSQEVASLNSNSILLTPKHTCWHTASQGLVVLARTKSQGFPGGSAVKNHETLALKQPLVQEDPTCLGATKLVYHSY